MKIHLEKPYPFNYDRCKSSSEACTVSKLWYENYCPFSGEHVSVINQSGLYLTGSHILKAGQNKFRPLAKYPIAVIPMREDYHSEYENLEPYDRFLWICEHAKMSSRREMIRVHLEMFIVLMVNSGINPEIFCGK